MKNQTLPPLDGIDSTCKLRNFTRIIPHFNYSFNIKSAQNHCFSFPLKCTLSILQCYLLSICIIVYHWHASSNIFIDEVDPFLKVDVRENFHSDAIQSLLWTWRVLRTSEIVRVCIKTQNSMWWTCQQLQKVECMLAWHQQFQELLLWLS